MVTAVISMARSLKLRVVAEGVETREQLAFLQTHQCNEAQRYYFSRPVPPQEFAKLLATGIAETDRVPAVVLVLRPDMNTFEFRWLAMANCSRAKAPAQPSTIG